MHEGEETIPLKKKKGGASFQNTPFDKQTTDFNLKPLS